MSRVVAAACVDALDGAGAETADAGWVLLVAGVASLQSRHGFEARERKVRRGQGGGDEEGGEVECWIHIVDAVGEIEKQVKGR